MSRPCAIAVILCILASPAWAEVAASPSKPDPRADFLKLIDRPHVPLNPQVQPQPLSSASGTQTTAFTFDAEKGEHIPGILVSQTAPSAGKHPVVIYLHGTGGKKEDGAGILRTLAEKGFLGVSIDGRYHGARAANFPKEGAMNAYETAIFHAWKEHDPAAAGAAAASQPHPNLPLYYDTVWDVMRLVDYLQTRDDVDPARIGLYGVSKGGIEAYLAAAADPRIAACVPCISVESFRWALDNDAWKPRVETFQKAFDAAAKSSGITTPDAKFAEQFYDRVMPRITSEFDGPSIIPLIAPRPLMAINGEKDPRTQPPALKLATDAIQAAYHAGGADDHFTLLIQSNTPHQVKPEAQAAGVDFLVKWLKP